MNFELLREMDTFTEEMLNRIIAFQTKEHPAWNSQLAFEERIRGLALHDLVFSHPQRDPKQFGPTVTHYYPRREEMWRIAHYARCVAENPVICDIHARNGFLGSLLARENVRVAGLRDPRTKPNQIADFFDAERYELHAGTIDHLKIDFDVAYSAWMPAGENHTPAIVARRPKLIVFVHSEHIDQSSGLSITGTPEAFAPLPEPYRLIDEWHDTRPENLFKEIWPDLTGNMAETRVTRVYAAAPYHDLKRPAQGIPLAHYDWETDLEMASLALEAKKFLKQRGVGI